MTNRIPISPERLRIAAKAYGGMEALCKKLSIGANAVQAQARRGSVTPALAKELQQHLGPSVWRYVTGESNALEVAA